MTNRENLYRFLSRLYRFEVDESMLTQMKAMKFPVQCSETELSEGYQMLKEYLKSCTSDSLNDLAVDYAKVFLGAGIAKDSAAFPYESVYTSKKRIIMQEAQDQVKVIYSAKGLSKEDKRPELFEDHIALELEFMAFLCQETKCMFDTENESGILSSLKEEMDFLKQHLLNWICKFCADVEKYADTEFYKGIGKITNGYLKLDYAILENLKKDRRVNHWVTM